MAGLGSAPITPSTTSPAPPEPDDFFGAQEKNGVMGIIDSMRLIEKYQIKSLQRESGRASSLKQENIFMKATGGKNRKQMGWTTPRPSASG